MTSTRGGGLTSRRGLALVRGRDLSLFAPPSEGRPASGRLLARRFTDVPWINVGEEDVGRLGDGVGHLLGVVGVFPRLSALIAGSLLFLQAHQLGAARTIAGYYLHYQRYVYP